MKHICLALLAVTAACSPYVYEQEIAAFSDGMSAVREGTVAGRDALIAERAETLRLDAILSRSPDAFLSAETRCFDAEAPGALPCMVVTSESDATRLVADIAALRLEPTGTPGDPGYVPGAITIVSALQDYGRALKAVSDAEDRARFDAAASRLATEAGTLIGLALPGAGAVAGAGIELAAGIGGAALDARRLAVLRRVVTRMETDPETGGAGPVPLLLTALKAPADDLRQLRLVGLEVRGDRLRRGLGRAAASGRRDGVAFALDGLTATADAINAVHDADLLAVIEAARRTHTALAAALNDPERQRDAAVETASDLVQRVEALRDALTAL